MIGLLVGGPFDGKTVSLPLDNGDFVGVHLVNPVTGQEIRGYYEWSARAVSARFPFYPLFRWGEKLGRTTISSSERR